jgi:hypothetical protein
MYRLLHLFCLFSSLIAPTVLCADLVKLNNGGEIRGKLASANDSKSLIRLETLTGANVLLERSDTQFVTHRSMNVEEYETRVRRVEDRWQSHWELAEWCRQKGLSKQRETHLLRVTILSPDHDKAQQALGRVWHEGAWVDRDQLMASKGFVKYRNKYITPQELEVIENTAEELDRERSWFQKVRQWYGWLNGDNPNRSQQAMASLKAIDDPHAAQAVIKIMAVDSRVPMRELAVAILVKISGKKATTGLVNLSLYDESFQIRSSAMEAVGKSHSDVAQTWFVKALKHESNAVVCRAATALGQIGDDNAIRPLIDALITAHYYQVAVDAPPGQVYSFNVDGSTGPNTPQLPPEIVNAVRTGHLLPPVMAPTEPPPKRLVTVRVEQQNVEVLDALSKLTHQNFGYDRRTWILWLTAQKNSGAKISGVD